MLHAKFQDHRTSGSGSVLITDHSKVVLYVACLGVRFCSVFTFCVSRLH